MDAKITYINEFTNMQHEVLLSEIIEEIGFEYMIPDNVSEIKGNKIIKIEVIED